MKTDYLLLYILSSLFCSSIYSQTDINGVVKDSTGNLISLASVQILRHNTNEIITYKSTNNLGAFSFTISEELTYFDIKIAHISYHTQIIQINNSKLEKAISKEIILKYKENQLQEIKLKTDFKSVEDKNDTIKYNLKKLTNGSENKLKDIINKLPGLKIDENGKIRFNGKIINNFLIEGDELYDNQHQLATENIKSEMIDRIEVLKNYKNFSSLNNSNGDNKTALNIYIKDEYKNKINGTIEGEGGYKKRYKLHDYTFNFSNKLKASLIADINNVNSNILTINDYLELKKTSSTEINKEDSNNSINIDNNVPDFLFAEDDVKSKTIKNMTFNFNHSISEKTKLQGYSVTNILSQNQLLDSKQLFYSTDNSVLNKLSQIDGNSIFNSNYLKFENKSNQDTYTNYTISTNYSKDKQNSNFVTYFDDQPSFFNETKSIEDFRFGQNFSFKKNLKLNKKIDFIFYNEISNSKNDLYLESNTPFLNLQFSDNYAINQNTNQSKIRIGFKFNYNYRKEKNSVNFKIGSSLLNENFNNMIDEINPNYNFKLNSNQYNNFLGINYSASLSDKSKFVIGADLNYNISDIINYDQNNDLILLPSLAFSHNFNKKINFNISYKRNLSMYVLNQFIKGDVINDYRTILKNNSLTNNSFLITNQYSVNFMFTNFDKNFNTFFNIIYESNTKNIGENSLSVDNTLYNENKYIDLDDTAYLFWDVEKKFNAIPMGINFHSMFSLINKEGFNNYISNEIESFRSKLDLEFISYFKNNDFNYNFGISYINSYSDNFSLDIKNKLTKIIPYVNINGLILKDKLNWELKSNYLIYTSSDFEVKNILNLSPKLTFKAKDWNYFISGNNILNIKDNNIKIKSNSNTSFTEQSAFNSLSGYVNIGATYSF